MNPATLKRIQPESDRRCSAEELERILLETPIIIQTQKGSRLNARMGLGKIIYIKPLKGKVLDVKLGNEVYGDSERSDEGVLFFSYKGQEFEVQYH